MNTCGYACGFATQHNCFYGSPQVNSAYMNVAISSVCSDGTIYCQPPSRALTKMNETLEKIETYFHSQVNELRVLPQSFIWNCDTFISVQIDYNLVALICYICLSSCKRKAKTANMTDILSFLIDMQILQLSICRRTDGVL